MSDPQALARGQSFLDSMAEQLYRPLTTPTAPPDNCEVTSSTSEGGATNNNSNGPACEDAEQADNPDEGKQSQASLLVTFVEERVELFHDQNHYVYSQDKTSRETRRLDGRPFRDWLVASFYKETGKSPREQSVREALSTLAGLGRFHGECREVYVRVAKHEQAYYLDLAEPGKSRAVKIEAGRWEVMDHPPVRFIRMETQHPLPMPVPGGDLAVLWRLTNIPEDARLLALCWLLSLIHI